MAKIILDNQWGPHLNIKFENQHLASPSLCLQLLKLLHLDQIGDMTCQLRITLEDGWYTDLGQLCKYTHYRKEFTILHSTATNKSSYKIISKISVNINISYQGHHQKQFCSPISGRVFKSLIFNHVRKIFTDCVMNMYNTSITPSAASCHHLIL